MQLLLKTAKEQLLQCIGEVAGIVERKQSMPILSNLVLESNQGLLKLTASDGDMQLVKQTNIACQDLQPGITVSARLLQDVLRGLDASAEVTVGFDDDKGMLEIQCLSARFQLQTLSSNSYPFIEIAKNHERISFPRAAFREGLDVTHIAMAVHDLRYYLNGLLIDFRSDGANLVATDGSRLALFQMGKADGAADGKSIIIPRKAVLELLRLLPAQASDEPGEGQAESVEFLVSGSQLVIRLKDLTMITKLIEGRFPDYQRIIPKNNNNIVLVGRKDLLSALQRTVVVSHEKHRGVSMHFNNSELQLTAMNIEQEQAEDRVAIEYNGEELDIGFNSIFFMDVLSVLGAEKVRIALQDNNASVMITADNEPNFTYILMPMRI